MITLAEVLQLSIELIARAEKAEARVKELETELATRPKARKPA